MGMKGIGRVHGRPVDPAPTEGIGDTIRVSLTPEPGGDRELEVEVAAADPPVARPGLSCRR